jgi:hypothetical protein
MVVPLDQDFFDDALYTPEGIYFNEIVERDDEGSRLVLRMPTHDSLPITEHQRETPNHPRHVSGGLIVHLTGIAAMAHGYYVLGLRFRDGWGAFGARIKFGRYRDMAHLGPPLDCEVKALKVSLRERKGVIEYGFRFSQDGRLVYESEQTAILVKN